MTTNDTIAQGWMDTPFLDLDDLKDRLDELTDPEGEEALAIVQLLSDVGTDDGPLVNDREYVAHAQELAEDCTQGRHYAPVEFHGVTFWTLAY